MRLARTRWFLTLALPISLLLVAMVACGGTNDFAPTPAWVPETDSVPAPTPLPVAAREATGKFLEQKNALDKEWDALQDGFDQWRSGLTDCHGSAVYESLRDFAVDFAGVTEMARGLPPTSTTSELADILIKAAEQEEQAYRTLRDRWQPNNLSFFETVEQRRTQSADAQKRVANRIADMRERLEDAPRPDEVREFSQAFNSLKKQWKEFHDDYLALMKAVAKLQEQVPGLSTQVAELNGQAAQLQLATAQAAAAAGGGAVSANRGILEANLAGTRLKLEEARLELEAVEEELAELMERLSDIPREFEDIVDAVDRLPFLDVVETQIEDLGAAAEAELDALQGRASSLEEMMVLPAAQVEISIDRSEAQLKEATEAVKGIADEDPGEMLADLAEFDMAYTGLTSAWRDFQAGFSDWRKVEGGCDRTEALQALGQFALDFAGLGRKVRDLPQASHLLPMYNLLTDAAAREEGALRTLRNSWRPFTVDVFKAVDVERTNSDRLRRDANIALQELSERFP